ncbi:MAG: hypothetical protein Q4G03_12155, partial [Planctomycetia bacterium]|nr:hypothetical protein [Planctomycetia bacterium]
YRYAEACEGYYQFTLSTLLNEKAESAGVSPVKIFGYTREELRRQIEGLSARYPEFIGCSFTHDLEVVNLRPEKKSGWEEYSQPAPENDAERAAFQKNVEMKNTVLNLFYERD